MEKRGKSRISSWSVQKVKTGLSLVRIEHVVSSYAENKIVKQKLSATFQRYWINTVPLRDSLFIKNTSVEENENYKGET